MVPWTRVIVVEKVERSFAFWIYSGDRANRTCDVGEEKTGTEDEVPGPGS